MVLEEANCLINLINKQVKWQSYIGQTAANETSREYPEFNEEKILIFPQDSDLCLAIQN